MKTVVYDLEGTLLEACSCGMLCPCWVGADPDGGECNCAHRTQETFSVGQRTTNAAVSEDVVVGLAASVGSSGELSRLVVEWGNDEVDAVEHHGGAGGEAQQRTG